MKFLTLIAIFLIISPATLFARFRRSENSIGKPFKAERRQNSYGKFAGAGDLDPLISQQKPTVKKPMRSGNSNKTRIQKSSISTPQVSPSGPTEGWYYGSTHSEPKQFARVFWNKFNILSKGKNDLLKRLSRGNRLKK